MDSWLTDETKELFFQPCLKASGHIGRRLTHRLQKGEPIDERALTEDFVDLFDTSSPTNAWGLTLKELRDRNIYLNTSVRKAKKEYEIGADIGLVINRKLYGSNNSKAKYACLIQCKKIDERGVISEFYHVVQSSGKKQSSLMLDVSSSSFYFIFVPPVMLQHYCNIEPIAFLHVAKGCSVPVWNNGSFAYDGQSISFLSQKAKEDVTGILVVPALAVEAQESDSKKANIMEILPNCLPLWYWFGELLIPGFVGDRNEKVISIALNSQRDHNQEMPFNVNFSIELSFGNG
jgi:hypothetical protein